MKYVFFFSQWLQNITPSTDKTTKLHKDFFFSIPMYRQNNWVTAYRKPQGCFSISSFFGIGAQMHAPSELATLVALCCVIPRHILELLFYCGWPKAHLRKNNAVESKTWYAVSLHWSTRSYPLLLICGLEWHLHFSSYFTLQWFYCIVREAGIPQLYILNSIHLKGSFFDVDVMSTVNVLL